MKERKRSPNRRLRHARELRGWSQEVVVQKIGLSADVRTLRRWESGESLPRPEYRERLCELFGMNAADLGLIEETPPEAPVEDAPSLLQCPLPAHPDSPALSVQSGSKDQNRSRLLERVHAFWITGVFEQSLHGAALIALGLHEQREAVENPWRLILQQPAQSARPLPTGTRIIQVYDELAGELLILGEPGSGKTTLLLELARDLLERARQEDSHPIPVVFNLSSWAVKRQPLTNWLVEELNSKYQVPRKLGQVWVDTDQILPLLDGLDEVTSEHRAACVDALNVYQREHMLPMVVCSRTADYLVQPGRVLLRSAIVVQPLTPQQVDDYLLSARGQLEAVRVALRDDPVLQELATTPLMLSVLTLAYHGKSVEDLLEIPPSKRQRQIFGTYVQRMLERRGVEIRYTPQQTIHWLTWMAGQMKRHGQTEFHIEQMQPEWLPQDRPRRLYRAITGGLLGGLFGGLLSGLLGAFIGGLSSLLDGLIFKQVDGIIIGALGGLVIGLLLGFVVGLAIALLLTIEKMRIQPAEVIVWSWGITRRDVVQSFFIGWTGALGFLWAAGRIYFWYRDQMIMLFAGRVVIWLLYELGGALVGGLVYMLGNLLLAALSAQKRDEHLLTSIISHQSIWPSVRRGVFIGLLVGLTEVVFDGHIGGPVRIGESIQEQLGSPFGEILRGLIAGLAGILIFGLLNGFSSERLAEHTRIVPNQGIRYSLRNSILIGLLFGLLFWFIFWLVSGLTFKLFFGLLFGLLFAMVLGLINGGVACIQHAVLRLFLWRAGSMPLNYPRFLDYAAERIFLRKLGGGYIFIHRLLLEYFASLLELRDPQDLSP